MKQIDNKKLCFWCLGCEKLTDETFNGVMRCNNFIAGIENWQERWKEALKEIEK